VIWLNAIVGLIYVGSSVYILRRYAQYAVLFGYVAAMQVWTLVSCFYNDLGVYNFELFRYTETTPATTRLAFFYLLFNVGFLFVVRLLEQRPLARRDYVFGSDELKLGFLKLSAYTLGIALLVYMVGLFATSGIPIFKGIGKVLFYREGGPVERILLGYGFIIAFALGYFRRKRGRVSVNGLLLAVMMLNLVLAGNKFSALLGLAVAYYAAVFVRYWQANPGLQVIRARYVLIGVAAAVLVGGGAYASYMFWGREAQQAQQLLIERVLALQGHLWWATDYNLFVLDRFDSAHWLAEWNAIVNLGGAAEGTVGMKYVMLQAIGPERAFAIFDTGYLYTMAYPAILVLTLPYPLALGVQLLAGALFGGSLYYLHYSLVYRHFVRALIALTVIMPFIGVMSNGNFCDIVKPGVAVKLLALLVIEVGVLHLIRRRTGATGTEPPDADSDAGRSE
jgi:hypothetical protein